MLSRLSCRTKRISWFFTGSAAVHRPTDFAAPHRRGLFTSLITPWNLRLYSSNLCFTVLILKHMSTHWFKLWSNVVCSSHLCFTVLILKHKSTHWFTLWSNVINKFQNGCKHVYRYGSKICINTCIIMCVNVF